MSVKSNPGSNPGDNTTPPAGGGNGNPGGDADDNDPDPNNPEPKPGNVSYETHQRLLREKKRLADEKAAIQAKLDQIEREKLEAAGEYQKIAEAERQAREAAESRLKQRDEEDLVRRKLIALRDESGIDSKFTRFLDPDEVAVDPETGEIDKATLVKAAQKIRAAYPEFLKKPAGNVPPNNAPNGGAAPQTITKADWDKLPASEMRKWKANQIIGL